MNRSRYGLDQAEKLRQADPSQNNDTATLSLASLVIGSGVGGLTLADAVKSLLEAVAGANHQLQELKTPPLQRLDIVELFEDQALAIADACARISQEMNNDLTFELSIASMEGGLARPFFAEQAPWWRRIQVTSKGYGRLEFAPLTDKAAIDIQAHSTQTALIDAMLADVTASMVGNSRIAQSLFELLVPNPLKAQVEAQGGMVMLVDNGAAKYPWELLTNRRSREQAPLATRIGLIRQLFDRSGTIPHTTIRNGKALVIGDTQSGPGFAQLPGAEAEATSTCYQLNSAGYDAGQPLIRRTGVEIIMALTNEDYQIVHLAGHGVIDYPMLNPLTGEEEHKTGMVLGNGIVLSVKEIEALGLMPELVFINCCHLGANQEPPPGGPRHELAANLGTAFIRAGAKCVVAAGWAVDDAAAGSFAEEFYAAMLAGSRFGDAVTNARKAVYDQHRNTNTWGAYQCYGDYAFTLDSKQTDQPVSTRTLYSAREVEIEAENIRSQAHTANMKQEEVQTQSLLDALGSIAKQVDEKQHLKKGAACAAIGAAYHELGEFEESVHWSEQAQECEDGGVSVKALENRANALTRLAEQRATELIGSGQGEAIVYQMYAAAEVAQKGIELTDALVGIADTAERSSIRASAYKHHGFINAVMAMAGISQSGVPNPERQARESLFTAYTLYRAQADKALANTGIHDSYTLLNATGLWLYLIRQSRLPKRIRDLLQSERALKTELAKLASQFDAQPAAEGKQRFWDRTDRINLDVYRELVDNGLHKPANRPLWQQLAAQYQEEFKLASQRERDSVTKQLRILTVLLGNGDQSLEALAALYTAITSEPS